MSLSGRVPELALPKLMNGIVLPTLIAVEGNRAARRLLEFFAVNIRIRNTRAAYARAAYGRRNDDVSVGEVERIGIQMFCSQCGTQIAENSNFCSKCGNAVSSIAPSVSYKPKAESGGAMVDSRKALDMLEADAQHRATKRWILWASIGVVGIFVLSVVLTPSSTTEEPTK